MSTTKRNNTIFPSLINELLKPDWFGGIENRLNNIPAVNMKETATGYELELAVPGKDKKDFNIEIDKDILSVSLVMKTDETQNDETYIRKEFSLTSFKRSFRLPETINSEKIEANYENGILSFVLPKKKEALPKPKRSIALS